MTSGQREKVKPGWIVPTKAKPGVSNALQASGEMGIDQKMPENLEIKKSFHLQKLKEQVKLYEVEVLAIAIKVDYNQCSLLYRHLIETMFTSFSFTTGTC